METGVCIYCGRTLDLPALREKGGKYRCKNEDDCLEYQTRVNSPDSPEDPEDMPNLIKSFLIEAAQRISLYKTAKEHAGGSGDASEEATAAWAWLKSALDALAAEYRGKTRFQFHDDENGGYDISFNDVRPEQILQGQDRSGFPIEIRIDRGRNGPGRRRGDTVPGIHLHVLPSQRAGSGHSGPVRRPAGLRRGGGTPITSLRQFRTDIESRQYPKGDLQ